MMILHSERNFINSADIDFKVTVFHEAEEFLKQLSAGQSFDLVILDVFLDDQNGFEIARMLREQENPISILFISSSEEYLRDGYSVQPVQFLIKPIDYKALGEALLIDLRSQQSCEQRIYVQVGEQTIALYVNQILYVEIMNHTLSIHTKDDVISLRATLTMFESMLPRQYFCRCHNSYIVNLQEISSISRTVASLNNGITLPIGRKYYDSFQQAFIRSINGNN